MLMSHFEEPKVTEDEEPPTEQDKRKKTVSFEHLFLMLKLIFYYDKVVDFNFLALLLVHPLLLVKLYLEIANSKLKQRRPLGTSPQ